MTLGRLHSAALHAELDRVIGRLFLPGEETPVSHSRAAEIVARVLALTDLETEDLAAGLIRDFGSRHPDVRALFLANAEAVSSRLADPILLTDPRRILLGASFTAEFTLEGAALCNPSAVEHPDQTGMGPGQLRLAIALRAIGEGHISSIEFAEAIIGPGRSWTFQERRQPPWRPQLEGGEWSVVHFRAAAEHEGILNETSHAVMRELPAQLNAADIDAAVASLPVELWSRPDSHRQIEALHDLVSSAYRATFPLDTELSQRVLSPVTAEEHRGMEDARFVRFTDHDGTIQYRATYTAFDGRTIASRLIVTSDLQDFRIHRMTGDVARNKGMALFPRLVGGRHLALCRTDRESISLARSDDGVVWSDAGFVHVPRESWEIVQTGNCGPPLETDRGWLVVTHGVGPMRTYVLGALLLDLEDPTLVIGRTTEPMLEPIRDRRDGYVPNVVYSCGGLIHEGVLWIPIGIGDSRIGVCSVELDDLLASMTP
jgi:predicted GH43/DUF377 family glycosyl hydrolase